MSKTTKRKYVCQDFLEGLDSLPTDNQSIVMITAGQGNNLHSVITPEGSTYLVSMPVKFRKNVWVKRGSYVLVEPIEEGNKVKAEIVRILNKDDVKYLKREKVWPQAFEDGDAKEEKKLDAYFEIDDDLLVNNFNRRVQVHSSSSSDSSSDSSEDSDSDDNEDSDSDGDENSDSDNENDCSNHDSDNDFSNDDPKPSQSDNKE